MNRVSIVVPPNAAITLDLALAERMVEFTVQPCNRRESGKQLVAAITDVFPQLLTVSFLLFSLLSHF